MKSTKLCLEAQRQTPQFLSWKDEWIIPQRMGEGVFKENRFVKGKLMSKGTGILGERYCMSLCLHHSEVLYEGQEKEEADRARL